MSNYEGHGEREACSDETQALPGKAAIGTREKEKPYV